MTEVNLEKIKRSLEKDRDELVQRITALKKDKERLNGPVSADFADQAQEMENDEVIDRLESIESKRLNDIERALIRIENNTFGQCTSCEKSIPDARLMAVPFSDKCVECVAK
jgi:RNA polymerase-binding protein DksA